jgi:hypothetical protein
MIGVVVADSYGAATMVVRAMVDSGGLTEVACRRVCTMIWRDGCKRAVARITEVENRRRAVQLARLRHSVGSLGLEAKVDHREHVTVRTRTPAVAG